MTDDDNYIIDHKAAEYFAVIPRTLSKWKDDLQPIRRGRARYYPRKQLENLIGGRTLARLLTRKDLARRIDCAPRTLKSKEFQEKHRLRPIKLGTHIVRYHPEDVERFEIDQTTPWHTSDPVTVGYTVH